MLFHISLEVSHYPSDVRNLKIVGLSQNHTIPFSLIIAVPLVCNDKKMKAGEQGLTYFRLDACNIRI